MGTGLGCTADCKEIAREASLHSNSEHIPSAEMRTGIWKDSRSNHQNSVCCAMLSHAHGIPTYEIGSDSSASRWSSSHLPATLHCCVDWIRKVPGTFVACSYGSSLL